MWRVSVGEADELALLGSVTLRAEDIKMEDSENEAKFTATAKRDLLSHFLYRLSSFPVYQSLDIAEVDMSGPQSLPEWMSAYTAAGRMPERDSAS